VIDWDKAQAISILMEVVTQEARRETLRALLKSEGFRLTRTVPSNCLFDKHKLAEFIRLNTKRSE
jgi:hypothetical protein